jgi:hypothetical protein
MGRPGCRVTLEAIFGTEISRFETNHFSSPTTLMFWPQDGQDYYLHLAAKAICLVKVLSDLHGI